MKKPWAVFKREYLQAVRKKSFLIMTVLTPFLFAALMIVPSLFAVKGIGEKHVAIVDGTGRLSPAVREGLKGAFLIHIACGLMCAQVRRYWPVGS